MARSKKVLLDGFQEMIEIMRYLYLENTITITNAINVPLQLSMTENGRIACRNMNYPEFDPTDWTEQMDVETCMAIADQLRGEKPQRKGTAFKNRWEEIHFEVCACVSQNKLPLALSHVLLEKDPHPYAEAETYECETAGAGKCVTMQTDHEE